MTGYCISRQSQTHSKLTALGREDHKLKTRSLVASRVAQEATVLLYLANTLSAKSRI